MFFPANLVSVVFDYLQPDKYKQHMIFFFFFEQAAGSPSTWNVCRLQKCIKIVIDLGAWD